MLTVYGHRGLPSKAPENTIASFKAASEVEGIWWLFRTDYKYVRGNNWIELWWN